MSARAMASGTVSFGLVAIPIKLYSTSESSSRIRLNMVHEECGTRVKQQYYCPTCDEVVERDEIVKGYEFAKGQFVLFSGEELDELQLASTHAVEITEFVPLDQVDPIYYDRAYYLGPDKGGDRPYQLLTDAMRKTGRAGLGQYTARGKQYLVLLRPFEDGLLMQQLRYDEEIRDFSEVPVGDAEVGDKEMDLAIQIIEQISSEEFEPEQYRDEMRERLEEIIRQKVEGEEVVVPPTEEPKAQIIDLMEALKASLGEEEAAARKGPKAASRAKKGKKKAAAAGESGGGTEAEGKSSKSGKKSKKSGK